MPDREQRPDGQGLLEFLAVMRRLRRECGWKAAQTHRSLGRYLLEEAHEVLEAVDELDATGDAAPLREELGDLLLQVWFHAVVAEEAGRFTLDDVAVGITEKMVRRNPHVFGPGGDPAGGGGEPRDPVAINEVWEAVKAAEKPRRALLEGIAPTLPALLLADKALDRLDRAAGAAPPQPPAPGSPERAAATVEVGDRLLAVVAEARAAGVDPEQALRDAVRRRVPPPRGVPGEGPERR